MAATVTYNVANELMGQGLSAQGHDGYIGWQSAFLLNDGRICSFGTGNHVQNQSNAMRIIDPVAAPPAVSAYNAYPWTQNVSPPTIDPPTPFRNHYVTNYDNHPSIYIPSENKAVWFGHGVYDFASGVNIWTYGDQLFPNASIQPYTAFCSDPVGMTNIYNPAVGWSQELNMGIFFGASGGGGDAQNYYRTVKRNPSGSPTPWSIVQGQLTTVTPVSYARNGSVVIGEYFYLDGGATREFTKIHLPTMTKTASLAVYPYYTAGGQAVPGDDYFPQAVYDQRRQKIIMIGNRLGEYDVATNVWTDISPGGWPGFQTVRGVYHPRLDAIFFTGWNASLASTTDTGHFSWHKITFTGTGGSNWRQLSVNSSANPFAGGTKHVFLQWHPAKRRVYTWGGDFGNSGASAFGQPNGSSLFTTNDPVAPRSYNETGTSFRGDQYSIDPNAAGSIPWRLEQPYLPRNLSGTREPKPVLGCQHSIVWDTLRSKFWGIQTVTRASRFKDGSYYLADGTTPDPWARGDSGYPTFADYTPAGTWSWAPGASGSPGTWTLESTNSIHFVDFSGTSYTGGVLVTGAADERIGSWVYDPTTDRAYAFGNNAIFIFIPATKTYEYRTFNPSGFNYVATSTTICCVVGDWLYGIGLMRTTGSIRTSDLIRINLRNLVSVANGGPIADSASGWTRFTLPWSLSPGSVWESAGDASSKWQEHAGVCAVNGRVVVVKSYDTIIDGGLTLLASFNVDTGVFTSGAAASEDFGASSWVSLPETGEVLFGLTTAGTDLTASKLWAYSDRLVSGAADTTLPTVSVTAPSNGATVSGASVSVTANAADNIGVVGVQFTLDGVNLQTEDSNSPYGITWNTNLVANGAHTLRAVARDAAGNSTTSAAVNVTVSNVTVPAAPTNLRIV